MTTSGAPIFVVGVERSGTTLLRFMLASHPNIYVPPQSHFIPKLFGSNPTGELTRDAAITVVGEILTSKPFMNAWRGDRPDPGTVVDELAERTPRHILEAIYGRYAAQYDARRWGDKTPTYTAQIPLLSTIFPDALFVHIVRDGRDVALSMMEALPGFQIDIYFAARKWRDRIGGARAAAGQLPAGHYSEIRYERLVDQPEASVRELCQFLGAPFAPEMLEPHHLAREQVSARGVHGATRDPVSTDSAGRWRTDMSERDRVLFEAVAGDLLTDLGYDPVGSSRGGVTDQARRAALATKYSVLQLGRAALERVGVMDPS